MSEPFTVAILTCSDRCSTGQAIDTSGPALAQLVQTALPARVVAAACLPDDHDQIARQLRTWADVDPRPDLILTAGGTGLSPRDVTPEATASVLQRRHQGLLELARLRCYARTPRAFLSRGEAGAIGQTLIINLPGSQRGSTEMLQALLDVLPHALKTLRGEVRDHGPRQSTEHSSQAIGPAE
jgi:molybdenum cofactor synthesis domain-containing protein